MSNPVVTLNSSGITGLTVPGIQVNSVDWQWIMPNGVQGQSVQATRNDGTTPNPSNGSLVSNVLTQTYTWGTATWTYDTTTNNQLAITCAIHNTDANPITNIRFGSLQIAFQGSTSGTNFVGATGTGKDLWTASDPCILPMVWNGSSGSGQLTYSCLSQANYSIDLNVSSVYFWGYTFSGKISESIAAGATATFTFYLRWMLTTDDPVTKNSDITSSFSTAYPIQFHTNDIRPIGTLFLSGTNNIHSQNLRGWVSNDKGATIANDANTGAALPSGQGNFAYTLQYMSNRALSGLAAMGAQGIIVWDIEGHQYPQGTTYIGMPQQLSNLAPEMDAAADAFFAQFTSLGYKVGITLRADALTASTPGYSPTGHVVQAAYTSETQAASDLLAKAEYAYNRWGCTLFYVDSFGIGIPGSPYDAGLVWQSLVTQMEAASLPFCMFSSEFSVTRSHQYGAPFHQMKNSGFVLPGESAMTAYPKLQVVNDISDAAITSGHFNLESTLVSAMLSGNLIPMFRSWFQDASFTALQNAISSAKTQGWTGFLDSVPPPAFVQITPLTTFANPSPTATSITSSAFPSAHTAGNVILVYCNIWSGANPSDQAVFGPITDLAGNRYKLAGRFISSSNQNQVYIFFCTTVAYQAGNTITVPFAINQRNAGIYAAEYTGPAYIDTSSSQYSATGTSVSAGVTTTSFPNETLVSFTQGTIGGSSTSSIGTSRLNNSTNQMAMADVSEATAGSYTVTWTVPSGPSWALTVALTPTAPPVAIPSARPAMGWDSWRLYAQSASATETNMKAQAAALVSTGLANLGYKLFNVNDVLYNGRTSGNLVVNSTKFPSGDASLWSYIRGLGLSPAAYLAPSTGNTGCSNFPGSQGFEATDMALVVGQGAKYVMVDNCHAFGTTDPSESEYRTLVNALNTAAANASVSPIPLVVSDGVSAGQQNGGANYTWTTTIGATVRSITPDLLTPTTWTKLTQYIDYSINQALWSGPGSINWPGDYLPVGNGTLTAAEGRTAMALYCILSYPLFISADLTSISAADLTTLSNTELIAVNQDSLVDGGWLVSRTAAGSATVDVWVKKMTSGNYAVALSNRDAASQNITVNWSMFNQVGPFFVRDLFAHTNLGVMNTGYTTTVPSHDVAMIQLSSPFGGISFGAATSSECIAVWQALHRLLKIYGGNDWSSNPLQIDIFQMMGDVQAQYSALNNGNVITPADNP